MNYNDKGSMYNRPPPNFQKSNYQQQNNYQHQSNFQRQNNNYQKPSDVNDVSSTFNKLTQQLLELSNSLVSPVQSQDGWNNDYQEQGSFQANRNQTAQGSSNGYWEQCRPSQNNRSNNNGNFGPARNPRNFNNNRQQQQPQQQRQQQQPQQQRQQQQWPAAIPSVNSDGFPLAPPNQFNNRPGPYNKAPMGVGRGAHLLRKMGWRPGEGLGKDRSGTVQPLMMRGQTGLNKRGFSSKEEWSNQPKHVQQPKKAKTKTLKVEGKHPISVLCEYAMLQKWHLPQYIVKSEGGEPHLKTFTFSVKLNDVEYIMPDNTEHHVKKKAKEIVTRYCLEQLGIEMPKEEASG